MENNRMPSSGNDETGVRDANENSKAFPDLRWFITKQGLPVTIPFAALAVSLSFNILQFLGAGAFANNSPRSNYVIDSSRCEIQRDLAFSNGTLLKAVVEELKQVDSDGVISIITDYAAFGIYTSPDDFDEYFEALKQASKKGAKIRMILQTSNDKDSIANHQYAKSDSLKRLDPGKLKRFVGREIVKGVLENKDASFSIKFYQNQVEKITLKEWREVISDVEEEYIKEFEQFAEIQYSKYLLSMHMWSFTPQSGILAFVNLRAPAEETGFLFRGNNEAMFQDIFRVFESDLKTN